MPHRTVAPPLQAPDVQREFSPAAAHGNVRLHSRTGKHRWLWGASPQCLLFCTKSQLSFTLLQGPFREGCKTRFAECQHCCQSLVEDLQVHGHLSIPIALCSPRVSWHSSSLPSHPHSSLVGTSLPTLPVRAGSPACSQLLTALPALPGRRQPACTSQHMELPGVSNPVGSGGSHACSQH